MVEDDLEPLVTKCPNCSTRFRVTENQLAEAAGRVRCGVCLTVFTGADYLLLDEQPTFQSGKEAGLALDELLSELGESETDGVKNLQPGTSDVEERRQLYGGFEDELEGDQPALLSEPTDRDAEIGDQLPESIDHRRTSNEPEAVSADASTGDIEIALDEEPDDSEGLDDLAPEPDVDPEAAAIAVERRLRDGRLREISFTPEPRRWWVGGVIALFLLALVAQVMFFQFQSWSTEPTLRPVYGVACRLLGCELPVMRDITQMRTKNLVVRSHPDLPNALIVDAVIVNQAGYAQVFPDLELRFAAVAGDLVAGRRFAPAEYLAGELTGVRLMPPDTPIQVSLEIEDPGPDAVNYTLTFR